MKKEKPIIFSTPMVRAIQEGKKDMTRRVMKRPFCTDRNGYINIRGYWISPERDRDHAFDGIAPYCVGDILWVRESIQVWGRWADVIDIEDNKMRRHFIDKADDAHPYLYYNQFVQSPACGTTGYWKRPSIFMPRVVARIFLEVKHVHLEQIQSISERDAVREGITTLSFVLPDEKTKLKTKGGTFGTEFKHLWDGLNAKRGYGWDKNPWVWVIEFVKVKNVT